MNTLREDLTQYLTENRISQEASASAMGLSGSALSAWRNEKYNGDNNRVEALVAEYLGREAATAAEIKAFKRDFDFVPTSVYEMIAQGVELAEARGEIRPVLGDSGVGKTTALLHIKSEKKTAIMVQVYKGIRKNRFLGKLCKAAGFSTRGSFDDLFETLVEELNNTGRLIIVDEAEHLPIDALDALRRLNDFTGCGVVLVGLPIFYDLLRRYPYIYNRTAMPIRLDHLSERDTTLMVKTMLSAVVPSGVWHEACVGVGRDLKMIVLESMRVADLNNIDVSNAQEFTKIISGVKKRLGRVAV